MSEIPGKEEKPKAIAALKFKRSVEIIPVIRRAFGVRISIRWEPSGPTSGIWIVKAMGKEFMQKEFTAAVAKMAEFVLNAHNSQKEVHHG